MTVRSTQFFRGDFTGATTTLNLFTVAAQRIALVHQLSMTNIAVTGSAGLTLFTVVGASRVVLARFNSVASGSTVELSFPAYVAAGQTLQAEKGALDSWAIHVGGSLLVIP